MTILEIQETFSRTSSLTKTHQKLAHTFDDILEAARGLEKDVHEGFKEVPLSWEQVHNSHSGMDRHKGYYAPTEMPWDPAYGLPPCPRHGDQARRTSFPYDDVPQKWVCGSRAPAFHQRDVQLCASASCEDSPRLKAKD